MMKICYYITGCNEPNMSCIVYVYYVYLVSSSCMEQPKNNQDQVFTKNLETWFSVFQLTRRNWLNLNWTEYR